MAVSSCETVIPLDNDSERLLSLSCLMATGDTLHHAFVAYSSFDRLEKIPEAELTCYVNGEEVSRTGIDKGYDQPQVISFKASARPGDEVRLVLETPDGERAEACCTAPEAVEVAITGQSSTRLVLHGEDTPGNFMEFITRVEDRVGSPDWFRFQIFYEATLEKEDLKTGEKSVPVVERKEYQLTNYLEPLLNNGINLLMDESTDQDSYNYFANSYNILKDSGFKDSAHDFDLLCGSSPYSLRPYYGNATGYRHIWHRNAVVRVSCLNRETYSYLNASMYQHSSLSEILVNSPIVYPTNIEGGIGFFAVTTSCEAVFQFPDEAQIL